MERARAAAAAGGSDALIATLTNAVQALGRGFDVTSDARLLYCKGAPGSRLVLLDDTRTRSLVIADDGGSGSSIGQIVLPDVLLDVKICRERDRREPSRVCNFQQMAEHFNKKSGLSGTVPLGSFNSMFSFTGSWKVDAAATKALAMDGFYFPLYKAKLTSDDLLLRDDVKRAVPHSWDPPLLASFIENFGTHIITSVTIGGKDELYIKQHHSSQLSESEIEKYVKDIGDQRFLNMEHQTLNAPLNYKEKNFYMIRKNRTSWRLLKIGRLRASELNICQESTTYTESECKELLNRIHEENKSTGGLKFVTDCYGIVGFVKFLGPYYMLLITEREEIGAILGHTIYAITKSKIVSLPNSSVQSNMANSREERRYKKLFCTVDITQGFFFSYSYSIMQSLQKNMCEGKTGQLLYESMFIWNEFLTREIHSHLKSTLWTVYLVYGFFKQVKLSSHGKDFWLTLIARRSQHCAGTRYLKRGVDEDGNVANDVETEQIIFEDIPGEIPTCFSSIVQNRGSIPLFWSQETSKLNLKPDIILNKDKGYEATKLHFDNLAERYGKPIVILNLIKSEEKKPRESILRSEFASAVKYVDKNLSEDSHLKFLHWDLHKHYRSKAKNVLTMLVEVAACTLKLTDFFYCEMAPALRYESDLRWPTSVMDDAGDQSSNNICSSSSCSTTDKDDVDMLENGSQENMDSDISGSETKTIAVSNGGLCSVKSLRCQKGVLRTNCIDCLDRTNIAQYAYGLVALGHQLHALKLSPCPSIPLDATLADHFMTYYEKMGDTLSLQYGGSTAHNKIFSERRGQCKATIRYQELLRTFQRYYSNAFTDVDKQAAIDLFLGRFQPQLDKPAIWEHCGVGKSGHGFTNEISRYTAVVPHGQHFAESADSSLYKDWYSNFLDFESILSSRSFLEGEMNDRSTLNSPIESLSTQNIADGRSNEASSDLVENGSLTEGDQVIEEQPHDTVRTANKRNKFPDSFAHWVHHGEALYR